MDDEGGTTTPATGTVTTASDGGQTLPLDRRKDAFVLALTHDLRASFAALSGSLAVLRAGGADLSSEQAMALLEVMVGAVADAELVIDNLFDVERLEHGVAALAREPTDLAALAGGLVARSHGADRIELEVDDEVALIDPGIAERIVSNLVANALEHGGPGARVVVRVCRRDTQVLVQVDDTGPGIDAAVRPTVFEPFHASAGGGIGVGLYLVRQLALLHGGDAWIEDRAGGGTSVRVRLDAS